MGRDTLAKTSLTTLILLVLTTGCVSKATYQGMADQASKLGTDLSEMQNRYNELQDRQKVLLQEKADLEKERAALLRDKADLENARATLKDDNAVLTRDKEAMAAGKRELEEILAAREDALSKKIAGLRQEMASHVEECTRQLAEQGQKVGECTQRLAGQAEQLASATGANQQLQREIQGLRSEKEAVAHQMTSTYQALIDKMKNEIDNGQITISELKGKLTVNMVDAILFDSGKAEIKAEGLLVLQKVIDILKGVTDKTIRIEGHTDNVPIIGGLAQRYPSNWELAAARAVNVTRFLQDRGIDPRHLNGVAHGEYKPVADNDSETGRARNRRIEIVLANQD